MAVSFISASVNAAGSLGNVSVTPGATVTNDILLAVVSTHDNVVCTFPAGWSIINEGNNTTALRATTAWKRAVGVEDAFTITHSGTASGMGDCIVANALVFRGCASGTSVINTSSILHNASSSICNGSAILPSVNDCMIVFVSHDSDNGASATQTCTNPGVLIERSDNASTLNLDAAVATATRLQTSAANTGSFSCTLSVGPDVNTGTSIALAPHVTVEHSNSLVVCSVP